MNSHWTLDAEVYKLCKWNFTVNVSYRTNIAGSLHNLLDFLEKELAVFTNYKLLSVASISTFNNSSLMYKHIELFSFLFATTFRSPLYKNMLVCQSLGVTNCSSLPFCTELFQCFSRAEYGNTAMSVCADTFPDCPYKLSAVTEVTPFTYVRFSIVTLSR